MKKTILLCLLIASTFLQSATVPIVNGYKHHSSVPSSEVVTSVTLTSPRTDISGWLGFKFDVGASNITVTSLGRWVFAGNSGTHSLGIFDASGTLVVTVDLNTSTATTGQFNYVSITPTVLTAGNSYYMSSLEYAGGDEWSDFGSIGYTSAITSVQAQAFNGGYLGTGNASYVPVSFKSH